MITHTRPTRLGLAASRLVAANAHANVALDVHPDHAVATNDDLHLLVG